MNIEMLGEKQKRVARQSNPLSNLDMLEGDIFTRGTSKKVNWQAYNYIISNYHLYK